MCVSLPSAVALDALPWSARADAPSGASRPAVHADVLPSDMTRRVRGQIHGGALQVRVAAEAPQRGAGNHRRADDLEQATRQFRREEARADRVDADAVGTPLGGQGPGDRKSTRLNS